MYSIIIKGAKATEVQIILVPLATDINECFEGTHNCDPLANCVDANGSFTCECRLGYTRDGLSCIGKYISSSLL